MGIGRRVADLWGFCGLAEGLDLAGGLEAVASKYSNFWCRRLLSELPKLALLERPIRHEVILRRIGAEDTNTDLMANLPQNK